jgi:CheY-like chemotaxis protein
MSSAEARLAERRAQFLIRFAQTLQSGLELLERLEQRAEDADALQQLNKLFHKMVGSCGIYELAAICDLAIAAEGLCTRLLADGEMPCAEHIGKLKSTISAMSTLADEARNSPGARSCAAPRQLSDLRVHMYKVLSVEDDPEQADFIRYTLVAAGYQVCQVSKSSEFDDALASFNPDLVLLDLVLGDSISGLELALRMRRADIYRSVPIVFLTTLSKQDARVRGAEVTADEHIVKPVAADVLISTVERFRLLKR